MIVEIRAYYSMSDLFVASGRCIAELVVRTAVKERLGLGSTRQTNRNEFHAGHERNGY